MKNLRKIFTCIAIAAIVTMHGGSKSLAVAAICPPHDIVQNVTDVYRVDSYHNIYVTMEDEYGDEYYLYDENGNRITRRCYTWKYRYHVWIDCDICGWYVGDYRYESEWYHSVCAVG